MHDAHRQMLYNERACQTPRRRDFQTSRRRAVRISQYDCPSAQARSRHPAPRKGIALYPSRSPRGLGFGNYAPTIYNLFASGAKDGAIANHLRQIQTEAMGLSAHCSDLRTVTLKLRQVWDAQCEDCLAWDKD